MNRLLVAAAVYAVAVPAYAVAAKHQVAPFPATTVDLSSIINPIIQVVAAVLTASVVPIFWYVLNWVRNKLKLSKLDIDDKQRAVIDQALTKAMGVMVATLQGRLPQDVTVDVKNVALAKAANYAVQAAPDALKHFGITQDKVTAMLEARIGELMTPAAAAK